MRILFMWVSFGPYHVDRLNAVARLSSRAEQVIAVELSGTNKVYEWGYTATPEQIERVQVSARWDSFGRLRKMVLLARSLLSARAEVNFLCHYSEIETFVAAVVLRLRGRKVITMIDSKFDDRPRRVLVELVKSILLMPYQGAMVGGARSAEYVRFLAGSRIPIETGYDTVSSARMEANAVGADAVAFAERHFTVVARFVPKKNLLHVLKVFGRYCELCTGRPRRLVLCGSGELETQLRDFAAARNLPVEFRGFATDKQVAQAIAGSVALLLLSSEEQWGLVVNEALSLGVPVVVSDQVGARDELVRTDVNGYVVETDNVEGGALALLRLEDEPTWRRLAGNISRFREAADVGAFARAVDALIVRTT